MKLLLISNGFPPHQWAGTETYTAGLAKELHQRGHQIQVLCGGDWQDGPDYWNGYTDEVYQGVSVRRLNVNWTKSPNPFGYLYNNPVIADYLSKFLDELRPDLVHVTSCERLSASVLQVVKDAGLPLVLSLTDFWFLCPRITLQRLDGDNCDGLTTHWECLRCLAGNNKIYRWPRSVLPEKSTAKLLTTMSRYPLLTRQRGLRGIIGDIDDRKLFLQKAFQLPDLRITASSFTKEVFYNNGFNAPIVVQPYGHDIDWLKHYNGKKASKSIRIGFIGQLVAFKGAHLLLKAIRSLQSHLRDRFSLYIYGNIKTSAAYSAKLQSLAADMPNIHFCGTYSRQQSARVFAEIDVLVVPSTWYDFPLTISEAFATKTPVITTNLAGMAEAVTHEVNGLLFERGDVKGLARALQRIVTEPKLFKRLRDGAPPVKIVSKEVDELESTFSALSKKATSLSLFTTTMLRFMLHGNVNSELNVNQQSFQSTLAVRAMLDAVAAHTSMGGML